MVANVTTRCGASDKHYAPKPLVVCLTEVKGCGGQGHRPNGDTNRRSPIAVRLMAQIKINDGNLGAWNRGKSFRVQMRVRRTPHVEDQFVGLNPAPNSMKVRSIG